MYYTLVFGMIFCTFDHYRSPGWSRVGVFASRAGGHLFESQTGQTKTLIKLVFYFNAKHVASWSKSTDLAGSESEMCPGRVTFLPAN